MCQLRIEVTFVFDWETSSASKALASMMNGRRETGEGGPPIDD